MRKRGRWGAWIVMTLAAGAALLVAVYQLASNRPSQVVELMSEHQKRGKELGFLAVSPSKPYVRPAGPRKRTPGRWERIPVESALNQWRMELDASILVEDPGAPSPAAIEKVREIINQEDIFPPGQVPSRPLPAADWPCSGPILDWMFREGSGNSVPSGWLPWAAAAAFRDGETERGLALVRRGVQYGMAENNAPIDERYRAANEGHYFDGAQTPRRPNPFVQLLLVLDAAGAPREALAEALRLLLVPEDPTAASRRAWQVEEQSLQFQARVAKEMRGQDASLGYGSVTGDAARWVGYYALRPILLARTEEFLAAWRARHGARLAEAERALATISRRMGINPRLPSEFLTDRIEGPDAAVRWQNLVDCFGADRSASALEMGRFVAAAMLFHRDTGTWPTGLKDVVPAYLPVGAIDAADTWGVVELPSFRAMLQEPPDPEFQSLVRGYYQGLYHYPDSLEELSVLAPPGDDLARFADRFVTIPGRPIFYRCSVPAECFPVSNSRSRPSENPNIRSWTADPYPPPAGKQWLVLDVVGFDRMPPEGLLQLMRRRPGS